MHYRHDKHDMMSPADSTTDYQIALLNSLLRGELAAVETYDRVVSELDGQPGRAELIHIKLEHISASEALRQCIVELGGEPDITAGAWGAFARSVESGCLSFRRL